MATAVVAFPSWNHESDFLCLLNTALPEALHQHSALARRTPSGPSRTRTVSHMTQWRSGAECGKKAKGASDARERQNELHIHGKC
jgi:hypothetical protein